jgi:ketosteroid isomerase-like protein
MKYLLRISMIIIISAGTMLMAQSVSRPDSAEIRCILNVIAGQQKAWNEANILGYMEGYWQSDSLLFTSGGNIQRGWKATWEKYRKSYDSKEKMGTLFFSHLEVNILSPGAAWVLGDWELKRENDNPRGVFTLILKKFPDGWKIIHDHTSSKK